MDQTITFDKTLQERLDEFQHVLSDYEVLPVSAIEKCWAFYLDLTIDPNGWQAIWKIQRRTCEALNVPFPSVVLVLVLDLNLNELSAVVKVLAVQEDDIHIPERHVVPLIHLWPTKDQDKSVAMNLHSTANALDMLRFFYTIMIMPWDFEEDDCIDWRERHLESRLRLYYDMKNGVIPPQVAEHIHGLISEAKRLQFRRELLESEYIEDEKCDENNESVSELMEIHVRFTEIKNEIDMLENPILRNILIKKQKEIHKNYDGRQIIWLIFDEGKVDDYLKFLEGVKQIHPDSTLKFCATLDSAIDKASPGDVFLLNKGLHFIKTHGILEAGGAIKGMSLRDNTKITTNTADKMFDFNADSSRLENLVINAFSAQCAIIIRRGTLTINNCKIIGDGKSSTHQGIIVLQGATLEMENCEICNFSTAIVGNSGSTILMKNSEIRDVNFGLKIYDNTMVKALDCTFKNCNNYGICVETEKIFAKEKYCGTFDTLNIIPQLKIENVNGVNNAKGDALINQKSKLRAIEDLFENPDQDPTVCKDEDDDDEEMNIFEDTIIENS